MKRKIFSKLLMGAFLIASVSSFVSCKDYDDDINNLQKQIDAAALKAELTSLQSTLQAQIQAAQSAADKAQAAAQAAQNTANAAATKDALDAVKAAAEKAGTDAAKAIADAANAQSTANVAQTAADAAKAAAEVAQNAAGSANSNATAALADAAKALSDAAAAQKAAEAAQATANAAKTTADNSNVAAQSAQATADNAVAAAAKAAEAAASAVETAAAAKAAAEAAKYDDKALTALITTAQNSADAAALAAKDAAKAAADAAQVAATKTTAAEAAAAAKELIQNAIGDATKAIEAAADAKIKTAVAEEVAKEIAKIEIPADQSEAVAELTTQLGNVADAQKSLATAKGLADAVTELEGQIAGVVDAAAVAAVAAAAGTIDTAVEELFALITCVELFVPGGNEPNFDNALNFIWAKELGTYDFGKEIKLNATKSGLVTGEQIASEVISFKEGDYNVASDSLMIRVSPMKAELTPDMVALVNTQGDTIPSEFIQITSVKRYERLLTRAQSIDVGGLWVVKFAVDKDKIKKWVEEAPKANYWGVQEDAKKVAAELLKQTWTYNTNYQSADQKIYFDKQIAFALAVKHTAEDTPRRIVTEHRVYIDAPEAIPYYGDCVVRVYQQGEYNLDGSRKTEDKWVRDIHNRFTTTEDGTYTTPEVVEHQSKPYDLAYELNWNAYKEGTVTAKRPTTLDKVVIPEWTKNNYTGVNDKKNAQYRFNEGRQGQEPAYIQIGEDIEIDFTLNDAFYPAMNTALGYRNRIKGFYVALDKQFALESEATELQAWGTYEYDDVNSDNSVATFNVDGSINNVAKYFEGPKGVIRLSHYNDDVMEGEYIGFRIFAVNFDGTLVDPDGRAFYVRVGDPRTASTKHTDAPSKGVSVTAKIGAAGLTTSDAIAIPNDFFKTTIAAGGTDWNWLPYDASANPKAYVAGSGNETTAGTVTTAKPFTIIFNTKADGTGTDFTSGDLSTAKSYKIRYNSSALIEGQEYKVSLYTMYTKNKNYGTKDTLQIVDFAFKNVMPTALPEKAKLALQNGVDPDGDKVVTQYIAQHNIGVAPIALPTGYSFYTGAPATIETGLFDVTKVFKSNDATEDAKLNIFVESTDSAYTTDNAKKRLYDGFTKTKYYEAGTYAAMLTAGIYPINNTGAIDGKTQHKVLAEYADYAKIKRSADGKLHDIGKLDTGYRLIYADWSDAFDFAHSAWREYTFQPAYTGPSITKPANASYDEIKKSLQPVITFAQSTWNTYAVNTANGTPAAPSPYNVKWSDVNIKNVGNYADNLGVNYICIPSITINQVFTTKQWVPATTSADIEIDEELTLFEVGVYTDAAGKNKSELYDMAAPVTVFDIAAGNNININFIGNPAMQFNVAQTQYIVVKALTRYSLDASWKGWFRDGTALSYTWNAFKTPATGTAADVWANTGRHVVVALPFTIKPVE